MALARVLVPALTLTLGLSGCASLAPPSALESGASAPLQGRLALQVAGRPDQSFSADFTLQGNAQTGLLTLSGPLGSTAAQARWAPGEAVLRTPQGESREADIDALARQALGAPLPMAALFDWLRGRPWAGAPATPLPAAAPGFAQLGWEVRLAGLAEGRIEAYRAEHPAVTVRVRLLAD